MKRKRLIGFESKGQPVVSRAVFARRMGASFAAAAALVGLSLGGGMMGYHVLERMPWVDAFVNAAMILSGMGPVTELKTTEGKLFAGCYAIYSGLMLVLASGLILAPLVHRILHRFHIDEDDEKDEAKK